jgi:uncharacterized protein YjlB
LWELAVSAVKHPGPLTLVFADDGLVPNSVLPFVIYKAAINVDNNQPEKTIEGLFGANGWGDMWRNGIFDYLHYHATVHEALGVARGHARVSSAATRDGNSIWHRVTSPSCRPVPVTNASRRATIFRWSEPIRRVRRCT